MREYYLLPTSAAEHVGYQKAQRLTRRACMGEASSYSWAPEEKEKSEKKLDALLQLLDESPPKRSQHVGNYLER